MIGAIVEEVLEEVAEGMIEDALDKAADGTTEPRRIIRPGPMELACVTDGPDSGEAVILVHGLGQTIADWPEGFVSGLAAQGYRVVRLDNRDAGRSSRLTHLGDPALVLQSLGHAVGLPDLVPPPYRLAAMAGDVIGVMDGLGISRAHVVGVSMGGMIVQHLAALAPGRVLSMTCIMSSSGAPGLPPPREDVAAALATPEAPDLAGMLQFRELVAGPLDPADRAELAARVAAAFAYGTPHDAGTRRQYAAILADTARYRLLADLDVPTLVIHGEDDPFVRPDHGIDIANRIPGARRILLPRMGHEITASFAPVLAQLVSRHLRGQPPL
ncbi:alpha/beta hydrolase [Rhodobacter sp. HX-7-19]|uniref:Alpha/beta hydrolase n=1 Tax=Paragemmobacter kunshanensis TaxID=2583234 RepID=A0A6M1UBA9_9RHOB|nr:alpha/beta hydrolase [Rhodobacter kunshanensis]NGQ92901.1 alpha/beta hydrolase [Rhodobacter kunshanensis]